MTAELKQPFHCDKCLINSPKNAYTINIKACREAAKNGHLDCLKYAHENGYSWDACTSADASTYGHLDCLIYAHENGCPWVEWTCHYAAMVDI